MFGLVGPYWFLGVYTKADDLNWVVEGGKMIALWPTLDGKLSFMYKFRIAYCSCSIMRVVDLIPLLFHGSSHRVGGCFSLCFHLKLLIV